MQLTRLRRTRVGVLAAAVPVTLALAACGTTTIDNGKAEQLIKNSINSAGNFKVKSVSCPSGVAAKAGTSFECQLSVTAPDGSEHSGTVTIHQLDNNGHIHADSSDFHVQ